MVGYNHMIRFWMRNLFELPEIGALDYYMRLDTDSYILSPIHFDIFRVAEVWLCDSFVCKISRLLCARMWQYQSYLCCINICQAQGIKYAYNWVFYDANYVTLNMWNFVDQYVKTHPDTQENVRLNGFSVYTSLCSLLCHTLSVSLSSLSYVLPSVLC